ncbi:MAG: polyprenol monophosphomannose synthase [Acidimicrobiales bacterium]
MRTLVVLPTYEEAATVGTVLRGVRAALPDATVLVVDDGSPDGTAALAEAAGQELGGVVVMHRGRKAGLGSAYREAFAWGLDRGFEVLVEMDADLSHDPAALEGLVEPLARGVELVIGSRYVPGGSIPSWKLWRRALSRGGNVYSAAMLGLQVADLTSGYRAWSAALLRRVDLAAARAEGYGFQIEMVDLATAAGATVVEVPICFVDRAEGRSKMSPRIMAEALALVTWWGVMRLTGRRQSLGRAISPR